MVINGIFYVCVYKDGEWDFIVYLGLCVWGKFCYFVFV